jgi:hypothetical protein
MIDRFFQGHGQLIFGRIIKYDFVVRNLDFGEQPMESSVKINRLAAISLVSGLIIIALFSFGIFWSSVPSSPGFSDTIRTLMDYSVPAQYLCALVALVTGIIALGAIKKKVGDEKGKIFAWVGILIGAGYILLGLVIFIIFSAEFLT